jgi:hypothetical protein
MSRFTAKAVIMSTTNHGDGQTIIAMNAGYANGENKQWAKYTPTLSVSMSVIDEIAAPFKPGKKVDITFEIEDGDNE